MPIRLGLYDFFARTIPGGISVLAFLYILHRCHLYNLSFANLSTAETAFFAICSYMAGFSIDRLANTLWYRLFQAQTRLHDQTLTAWNERHSGIDIQYQEMDWYILLSYIKRHSLEMATEVEHFNVTSIMLRGSSFGIMVFALIFAIEFVSRGFHLKYAVFSVLCMLISIIMLREAVKFRKWFYQALYDSVVALIIKPEQLPIKFKARIEAEVPPID
ncbi:MAG TPA: hypothetical protein VJ302_10715 [Blastocatellia bacterium]|nr:hypothetical protein [Blastocatellia bacterium]